jgi:hypothetical protein
MRLGVEEMTASMIGAAVVFLLSSLLPFRFRRVVQKNPFHRGIMVVGTSFTGQLFCLRVVGKLLGLPLSLVMTLDLVALLWACIPFLMYLPGLLPIIPLAIVGGLVTIKRPESAEVVSSVIVTSAITLAMLLWNRAVQQEVIVRRAERKAAEAARAGRTP